MQPRLQAEVGAGELLEGSLIALFDALRQLDLLVNTDEFLASNLLKVLVQRLVAVGNGLCNLKLSHFYLWLRMGLHRPFLRQGVAAKRSPGCAWPSGSAIAVLNFYLVSCIPETCQSMLLGVDIRVGYASCHIAARKCLFIRKDCAQVAL